MVANVNSTDSGAKAREMIEAQKAKAAAAEVESPKPEAEAPVQEGSAPEIVTADKMLDDMDTVGRANFNTSGNAGATEDDASGVDGLTGDTPDATVPQGQEPSPDGITIEHLDGLSVTPESIDAAVEDDVSGVDDLPIELEVTQEEIDAAVAEALEGQDVLGVQDLTGDGLEVTQAEIDAALAEALGEDPDLDGVVQDGLNEVVDAAGIASDELTEEEAQQIQDLVDELFNNDVTDNEIIDGPTAEEIDNGEEPAEIIDGPTAEEIDNGEEVVPPYVVESGDTLGQIILDAGVPEGMTLWEAVAAVGESNGGIDVNAIDVGQEIDLSVLQAAPADEAGVESAAADEGPYIVQSGDTLAQIVNNAGLPEGTSTADAVAAVAEANGIEDINLILVGQEFDLSVLNPTNEAEKDGVEEAGVAPAGVDEPTTAEDFEDIGVGILQIEAGEHDDVIINEIAEVDGIEAEDVDVIAVGGSDRPLEDFEDVVQADSIDFVNNISDSIESILNDPESDLRVLNISIAGDGGRTVTGFLETAGLYDPATGEVTDPLAAQVLVDATAELLANDPDVAAAIERYRQLTAQAADSGLTIVVAADNEGRDIQALIDAGVEVPDGFGFNLLGQDSNVISVGNVETNDTQDISDDALVSTSSGGGVSFDGTQQFNPTFAADGNGIEGENGQVWSGTSFAAPQVVKAILDLLAGNADLTFSEILNALKGQAIDNPDIPENFDGFGVLFAPNDLA